MCIHSVSVVFYMAELFISNVFRNQTKTTRNLHRFGKSVLEQLMFQCAKSLITAMFHLECWRTSLFIFLPFCTLVSILYVCSCILDYVCAHVAVFFFLVNSSDIARRDTRTRALEEERHTGRRARHWTRWFSSVKYSAHIHIQRCTGLSSGTRLLSFICRF